jgi:4-azaleucine resistance transporter AzlC
VITLSDIIRFPDKYRVAQDGASGGASGADVNVVREMEKASDIVERGLSRETLPPGESTRLGFRKATPLAISSGLFGILYGAACASLGVSPPLPALSCILVFSGAVQFAVLGMLGEPFSLSTIAVSSLLICNRLFLMGASIADHFRDRCWRARLVSMFVLTDGAWAATAAQRSAADRFFFFVGAGVWILALWVLGTVSGGLIASRLEPDLIVALRFSGVLFLALLLLMVVKSTAMGHWSWIAAASTSLVGSRYLPMPMAFLMGLLFGVAVAWLGHSEHKSHVD